MMTATGKSVTPDGISTLLSIPKPESPADFPEIILKVTNLEPKGKSYGFDASDGKMKIKAIFSSRLSSEILSGNIQNMSLIRVLDYTVNEIPSKSEKFLIITKCEVVSPEHEEQIRDEVKQEDSEMGMLSKKPKLENEVNSENIKEAKGIFLKPKQEIVSKSAAQIIHEQHGNMAPVCENGHDTESSPSCFIKSLPRQLDHKSQGHKQRKYAYLQECERRRGTQIQATMFNEAAKKFYDRFELGKVYYISKGTLRVANKQFKTVQNDYEMTLNENSEVEEASDEAACIPETKFKFVPIDQLGPYVNSKDLVDVIGIVQSVSPTMSIRRKSNNETVPKRDIVVADETKKTVVVSLWNELATTVGQELQDIADKSPVVAIKSLKVGDFQGISLSTLGKSIVQVNPVISESKKLRNWYDSEGKETSMASVGSGLSPSTKSGGRSMYSDRVSLAHITSNPSLGEDKPAFFSIRAYISFIKPDQSMWYRACKTCNKKMTDALGGGYWCEGCQKNDAECSLRYIMVVKVSDGSGEGWVSSFNEEAEKIIGCSADELDLLKSQMGEENSYQLKLKEATWTPHLFRVSVSQNEYNNEKRQRITVRATAPVDFAAESKFLLEEISKMRASQ
ncbi:hypothetical protein OIU77_007883 [Salix suchowensis]|uniref:Replication protein A subunit n=1 Tax=Salix suchowensis TaxID=1278906 RepID=A0ABQ9AIX7_9ROSI|nr:hypothetical protein OIU77_007883 [Salix suchowensis]